MKKLISLLFILPLLLSACSLSENTPKSENPLQTTPGLQEDAGLTPSTNKADTASPAVIQSAIEAEIQQ